MKQNEKNFQISKTTDPDLKDKEHIFLFANNFIPDKLSQFPITSERAIGVFELASKIGGDDHRLSGIYLRASLGELVSIEETLKIDFPKKEPLKLNQVKNTLLHVLRELRNYQFHLNNVDLNFNESESTIIKENDPSFSMGPFKTKSTIIDNLELTELRKLKNIRNYYQTEEIEHMITQMDIWQTEYSIGTLVLKGLKFYTHELLTYYNI